MGKSIYKNYLEKALSNLDNTIEQIEEEVNKGRYEHLEKSVKYKVVLETLSEFYKKSRL
jgi:hypothetical protein